MTIIDTQQTVIREVHVNLDEGYRFSDYDTPARDLYGDELDTGEVYRTMRSEFGRCTGRVYQDTDAGTVACGWVFLKRDRYEDAPDKTYLHETWVTIHRVTAPVYTPVEVR